MKNSIMALMFSVAVASGCFFASGANGAFLSFLSKDGFKVDYPASWHVVGDSKVALDIISSEERVEGAVIPRGEAEITVRKLDKADSVSLKKFLEDAYGVDVVSINTLPNKDVSTTRCKYMEAAQTKFEIAPNAVQEITFYSCYLNDVFILISYNKWSSDNDDIGRIEILWNIIRSIRMQ